MAYKLIFGNVAKAKEGDRCRIYSTMEEASAARLERAVFRVTAAREQLERDLAYLERLKKELNL